MPLLVSTVSAATATISLGNTSQGPCGKVVTVTGSGFTPNTVTALTFGGALVSAWTVTTDINGAIPAASTFTVGNNIAPGQYYVIVTDNAGHSASAIFTITTPVVNMTPTSGITGSTVYLTASGFASNIASATLNGAAVTLSTSAVAQGTLTATFTVPAVTFTTAYPTTVTLTLTDANGNVGTATYTMGAPSITGPATAACGSTITVSGSGFASGATVTIAIGASTTTTTATSAGTISQAVTVPSGLNQGAITVFAYETAALATNRATYTLTIVPAISIVMGDGAGSPSGTNTVPKNDASGTITITGSGFAASSAVTLSWSPTTPSNTFASITTTSTGAISAITSTAAAFTSMGTWTLTATDAAGNTATAQLVVKNSGVYWIISPASGPVGTTVTAKYFGATAATAGVIQVGGVTATGFASSSPTAAAYPTATTTTFVIPALAAGTYAVTGTNDWAVFNGLATFQVTSSAPSVTLASTSAAKGQVVGVTGSGFVPSSTVTISVLGNSLGTITASTTGAISGTFTVPNFQPAAYDIQFTDTSYNTAIKSLTITAPTAVLSKTTIQPSATGTRVYFNATGYAFTTGDGPFTITIDGSATGVTVESTLMNKPNGFGVAYGSFTVDTTANLLAGQHTIAITDAQGNTYTQKITVVPTITLSPTAAPAGNTVTLSGSPFAATSKLSLALNGTYLQLYTSGVAGATTSGAGAIPASVTFTIPATTAGGSYTITVADEATPTNNTQTASFTVTSPTMTLTPSTGAAGITVTITGAGWLPSVSAGTISWGTTILSSGLTTGGPGLTNGKIVSGNTFTVPQVPAGNYTVTVSDGVESLSATFTVATAAISLNAATAQVGDVINVTGSGFNPGITMTLGTNSFLTFGGASITTLAAGYTTPVTFANGTLGCTQTATATQVQGIPFVVPTGSVAGSNTVTLTFAAPALSSSQTITVVPKITSTTTGILKGTPVTVSGTGFAATSDLTATLGGQAITFASGSQTIAAGTTTATFSIPVTASTGANTLVITDAAGNSASMTLTIGTPSIASLSATSGSAGTSIQVTGTGFYVTTGNQIFISFDGITLATNPTTVSTSTGSFIAFITVPAGATVGAHTIAATDSNNNQATASFEVTSGSTGSALPDTTTMQNTAKTTTPSGTATTSFTAGSTVKAGFTLQTASGSRSVVVAVTFQQGAKVYNMASQTATMSTTPTEISFSNLIPAGATGTWTAQLQVFAADGVTALAVQTLTFTVA